MKCLLRKKNNFLAYYYKIKSLNKRYFGVCTQLALFSFAGIVYHSENTYILAQVHPKLEEKFIFWQIDAVFAVWLSVPLAVWYNRKREWTLKSKGLGFESVFCHL